MWAKVKERLKSKVVWLAVIAQVVLIITLFAPELSDTVKIVATSLIEIATLFGVLNNPSDSDNF